MSNRFLLSVIFVSACTWFTTPAQAQTVSVDLLEHRHIDPDAPHDTPANINEKYTTLTCPKHLEKLPAYAYGIAIIHVAGELGSATVSGRQSANELRNSARPSTLAWWSTNEAVGNEMRATLTFTHLKDTMPNTSKEVLGAWRGWKQPQNGKESGVYFLPAKRNEKHIESVVVLAFIYNPADTNAKKADANPRILSVAPVVIQPQAKGRDVDLTKGFHGRPAAFPTPFKDNGSVSKNNVVWARVEVSASGQIASAQLDPASEYAQPSYFQQFQEAFRKWRFEPGRENGKAVVRQIMIPLLVVPKAVWEHRYLVGKRRANVPSRRRLRRSNFQTCRQQAASTLQQANMPSFHAYVRQCKAVRPHSYEPPFSQ